MTLKRPGDRIERAIQAIADGEFVLVVDDEDRENEGDLILAAEKATPEKLAFMVRHTSGLICVPMTASLDGLTISASMLVMHTASQLPEEYIFRHES